MELGASAQASFPLPQLQGCQVSRFDSESHAIDTFHMLSRHTSIFILTKWKTNSQLITPWHKKRTLTAQGQTRQSSTVQQRVIQCEFTSSWGKREIDTNLLYCNLFPCMLLRVTSVFWRENELLWLRGRSVSLLLWNFLAISNNRILG